MSDSPQPRITTRFAPSPTGYLHLGHLVHMLFVWAWAEELEAEIVLRMEDHDQGRCRPEFETEILADLAWLGFEAHAGLQPSERPSPYRQSDCSPRYDALVASLAAKGLVYGCDCSRKQIQARTPQSNDELCYDNHCRDRGLPLSPEHTWRLRLPEDVVSFEDAVLGPQRQNPAQECGDLSIRDRNGHWTYHFCVVADDLEQGIQWVIRGEDLLFSTGRQLLLRRILGSVKDLHYAHHPLLCDAHGRKLSKRDFDAPLRRLRLEQTSPVQVIGAAIQALEAHPGHGPMPLDEALAHIRRRYPLISRA